ncbi:hypothetical protein FOQG_16787 [Fusarium oxysporum f. sp. raphani 54005]|uniref:Uncharacterized protein n=3 Tax=Fusarium oxysporum TaxID=5507 RepID=X0C737_FUSOX|nr:hypothetical protein FOVG_13995 [Fusarium oxysporum f. sp. pisi HDV247]EXK78547.1 hypothetical protein FOQG_16787 [Fusarium oxysporum f. sp. raphani 54005]EXL72392.1 hypothetical protein FOPG_12044 [Fusarium oxysporum f. sp. conglutinans race 2 54008]
MQKVDSRSRSCWLRRRRWCCSGYPQSIFKRPERGSPESGPLVFSLICFLWSVGHTITHQTTPLCRDAKDRLCDCRLHSKICISSLSPLDTDLRFTALPSIQAIGEFLPPRLSARFCRALPNATSAVAYCNRK